MVVENRRLLTVDFAALAAKAEAARERLAAANKPAKALYDKLEKIVGTFCPGLAKTPLHIDRFGGGAPPCLWPRGEARPHSLKAGAHKMEPEMRSLVPFVY